MAKDDDHYKKIYKELWYLANKKEEFLREYVQRCTELELEPFGLGAESTEFIPGTAAENDNEKGAPDYWVKDTNVFIEVTGPFTKETRPEKGLWVRPDKLNYAFKYRKQQEEFIALYFPSVQEWRIIHANDDFFDDVLKEKEKGYPDEYKRINPWIHGNREKYVVISDSNPHVRDINYLITYLINLKETLK